MQTSMSEVASTRIKVPTLELCITRFAASDARSPMEWCFACAASGAGVAAAGAAPAAGGGAAADAAAPLAGGAVGAG